MITIKHASTGAFLLLLVSSYNSKGMDVSLEKVSEKERQDAIISACAHGDANRLAPTLQALQGCLEEGGLLALSTAIEQGYQRPDCARVIELLADHGADVNCFPQKVTIEVAPLCRAALRGAQTGIMEPINMLLAKGANSYDAVRLCGRPISIQDYFDLISATEVAQLPYLSEVLEIIAHRSAKSAASNAE